MFQQNSSEFKLTGFIYTVFLGLTCCTLFSILYTLYTTHERMTFIAIYSILLHLWKEFFLWEIRIIQFIYWYMHASCLYCMRINTVCIQSSRSGKASSSLMEQQLDLVCVLVLSVKVDSLEDRS